MTQSVGRLILEPNAESPSVFGALVPASPPSPGPGILSSQSSLPALTPPMVEGTSQGGQAN